jgi:hypothetical protein
VSESPQEIDAAVARAADAGERFVVATALEGEHTGSRLVVWPAGHTFGDLGWPRLNQRVALYAEQLLERSVAVATVKPFDVPGRGKVAIRIEPRGENR